LAQVRVKISSDAITETVITPIWSGEFSHKRERDRVWHSHEMKDIVLTGADFHLINDLANACEQVAVTVEVFCGGEWVAYPWSGYFTKFDTKRDFGGINHAQCRMEAKVRTDDLYDCIQREWEDEIGIYSASSVIQVKPFKGTYEILGTCTFCSGTPDPDPCDDLGVSGEACLEYSSSNLSDDCPSGQYQVIFSYHRIVGVGTPTVPPTYGTGWTYLSGNNWWRCPDETEIAIGVLRYGRRFDDTFEYLVAQTGCGLTLKSHFFGINATHASAPSNAAYTFATSNLQDMTVHQKSDVKRPDASNASFVPPTSSAVWKMKLKDLLEDLRIMFSVYWKIDGTDLIVEHISYFADAAGSDYTEKPMTLSLEYNQDTPRKESFKWSDPDVSALFKGQPITYDCGNGDKEYQVKLFTTDVPFITNEANQEAVRDDGYVLICNEIIGGEYIIIDLNYPLRWSALHTNLHKHNRPFGSGTMNGEATTFTTVEKIQKQPAFTVGMCCDEVFDPSKYITTALGNGQVESATRNLKKDRCEFNLNYE